MLTKSEIIKYSSQYNGDYPWWIISEEELGKQIRRDKQFGLDTLRRIVEWKFYTLPGRMKRTYNLLQSTNDTKIRRITKKALSIGIKDEEQRVITLRKIKGIGISLASVILTLYDPKNYCIYDIHVMRELYGKEPKYMFTSNKHYLNLLEDLRKTSKLYELPVRQIEKALFTKNIKNEK